jgi:hypothetical protein
MYACRHLGLVGHLKLPPKTCLTTGPRVSLFRFSLILFSFAKLVFSTEHYFPHISNVATRVCRSTDSWEWRDRPQITVTHLPTPPKCSTRVIMALINNLGIVYHQYCSSSIELIMFLLGKIQYTRPVMTLCNTTVLYVSLELTIFLQF